MEKEMRGFYTCELAALG